MIMESPEPSKNNASSSASTINAVANTDSPQVQESPFFRFVNNLSPIKQPAKACHVAQGFVGLNSPPLVFTSPRISCHRETQFLERPPCTQSPTGEISQSDNRDKSINEAPGDSGKSTAELPPPGKFITDAEKDFDVKNDANTQNCSPQPSVDEYLADPVDIDQVYSVNPDVKQSNDAESSLSDSTQSKKIISESDSKDGPADKADKPLLLLEESNKVPKRPTYVEEPGQIEGEIEVVEWASQERTKDHNDCTPQSIPEQTLQDVKECEDCDEMVSTSQAGAENISQDASEASLKHHGLRRRCLQFEEAASNALGSNKSLMKSNATPSKMKMIKLSEPVTSLFPQRCSGNLPATCSKPSGIGLHLNSIVNAMPPGHAATTGMRSSDGLQGMKSSSSTSLHEVENMKRCLISSNMDGQASIDIGNESHVNDASIPADSFVSESPNFTEPIALCPQSLHDKRQLSPTDVGNPEEFKQPSPSKKKKRTSSNTDDNGCKRCNCKKSKCLKLYCDCFAAGIYCADACSCQGCLNRPEYENKVLETRKQIESRNPLAFLPKIVPQSTDLPSNNMEDTNLMTPSSARHKRGCNCKRSMCLKKYCECYQANVGCSSGCRCEGCKNVYGTKEDYVARDHAFSKERMSSRVENGSDSAFLNKLEMVASKTDLYDLCHLSPITPSLQCSDQGKEAAKSRLHSGKHLPSPESDANMLPSSANLKTNEMLGTASYDWQVDCNNLDIMDQSSPDNSVANILQVTPLSNPESMSSASLYTSSTKEGTNIPQLQSHGCIRQLSGSSLRWRSSPNSPRTRLGEKQHLQSLDSESKLFDIMEDETPDILKEGLTPIKSVKANSPNQKRVSPPHSHLRGLGSSSSGGFRNGRKFILKSVPSFPPLTPCVDSKGSNNEDLANSGSK